MRGDQVGKADPVQVEQDSCEHRINGHVHECTDIGPERYRLEGVCTWTVGDRVSEIGPGDSVFIPRGQVHGVENRGSVDTKFLAIATPGLLGAAYLRDIAQVLADGAGGPPDLAAIGEVMRRHGLAPA
jgi:hypothetical protein